MNAAARFRRVVLTSGFDMNGGQVKYNTKGDAACVTCLVLVVVAGKNTVTHQNKALPCIMLWVVT